MLPERRTRSCTTEPCSISNQRERVDLPMTIWVTLLALGVGEHVVGDAPVAARHRDRLAAERLGKAQRVGDAVALLLVELQRCAASRRRAPSRARAAGRPAAWRSARGRPQRGSSLTQTRMRSPAAHGPGMACACICVSSCSSTRSAVRRSASSRSAVRLPGEKKCSSARCGLPRNIDLAFLQPLDQVVGRQIDELDVVGAVEDGVRHRFAHATCG